MAKLTSYEFKARLRNEQRVRSVLKRLRARFIGTDRQVDTYFRVPQGRLKLREGRIENALIFYRRPNRARARRSDIRMLLLPRRNPARAVLAAALKVLATVRKRREIYFVGRAKIHLDRLQGLGKFVEVEAFAGGQGPRAARRQAHRLQKLFGIAASDLFAESYSDLVLRKRYNSSPKAARRGRRRLTRAQRV